MARFLVDGRSFFFAFTMTAFYKASTVGFFSNANVSQNVCKLCQSFSSKMQNRFIEEFEKKD